MKTETGKFYSCEHCSKINRYAGAIISHEKACKKNPENINACVGCKFLEVKKVIGDDLDLDVETVGNYSYNTFKCLKLNQEMYPAKAKRKIKDYPESFVGKVQMPNTCEHYEAKTLDEILKDYE